MAVQSLTPLAQGGSSSGRRGAGQAGLVGDAGAGGFGHGVVDFEDDALGAVLAVPLGFILALHDGEGVHDVGHGVAGSGELALSRARSSAVSFSAGHQSPFASAGR